MMTIPMILGIVTSCLSIITFTAGVAAWVRASDRKRYASEQEIGNVVRTLNQLSDQILYLTRENERRHNTLENQIHGLTSFIQSEANRNQSRN